MESVKFDRIVSVNSEIEGHGARNLLDEDIRPSKNWMCEKGTEKAVVILQLDKPTVFASIHVGNAHSAFVEILVGKAADADQHFESLLPMSILMKPQECKSGENKNQTRFFGKADFDEATAAKPWDRMKVVCSQPFNKYVPYGLCFLKVQGVRQDKKVDTPAESDGGDIKIGSFFKKKRESNQNKPLTVSEQIKQAEKELSAAAHTPIDVSKLSAKLGDKLSGGKKKEKSTEKTLDVKTPRSKNDEARSPREKKEDSRNRRNDETPKKHDEAKKSSKKKSTEKDDRASKKRKKEEGRKKRKKPFQKLMDDVVLVISGFENPLRGDIKRMALEMGARYSADWDSHCTHLVCAFESTPKFKRVQGKGKIVKKDWVEKCHRDRKRYPWRRYALEKINRGKPESEEEIDGTDGAESEEEANTSSVAGTSQGEERQRSRLEKSSGDEYNAATDDDDDDDEKDKAEVETTDYPMPFLPDIFSSKTFFVDPNVKSRKTLERYIIAYNGTVTETFNEGVGFYVTEKGGAPVELFRKRVPNLVAIKPSWIWEARSKSECVPTTPHLVK